MLQNVAKRVQECVAESDTVARFGGDEFVILLPSNSERNDVFAAAEKIHEALPKPFALAGNTVNISISIGLAIYPDDGDAVEPLLSNADAN